MDGDVLRSPDQLPDLPGGELVFTWDQEGADSIVAWGERVVWRERTGWEVYERFAEIAAILQRKYGRRLTDLVPTRGSEHALLGDSSRASAHVRAARARLAAGPALKISIYAPSAHPDAPSPNLAEQFLALSAAARKQVHRQLCAAALDAWRRYADARGPVEYVDSVVGMSHTMDLELPAEAYVAAFGTKPAVAPTPEAATHPPTDPATANRIEERYHEPVVAIQHDDLQLPEHVVYAYYAIYNAFLKYCRGRKIDDWIIANQALSADPSPESWAPALAAAISGAAGGSRASLGG